MLIWWSPSYKVAFGEWNILGPLVRGISNTIIQFVLRESGLIPGGLLTLSR